MDKAQSEIDEAASRDYYHKVVNHNVDETIARILSIVYQQWGVISSVSFIITSPRLSIKKYPLLLLVAVGDEENSVLPRTFDPGSWGEEFRRVQQSLVRQVCAF